MLAAPPDAEHIAAAAETLRRGGLVAFPTETVYGLGADATNDVALRRLFEVKGRPADHPLIVHVAGAADLDRWAASVPTAARALADAFWPGPLTVVVPRGDAVSPIATGRRATVGLRAPAHPVAQQLLDRFDGAVAAPSANRFGRVSPTTAAHVVADLDDDVDAVLDGGPCLIGVESTIVDCTADVPRLLRSGAVSPAQLETVLGVPVRVDTDGPPEASGMLEAHYAPRAAVVVVEEEADLAAILAARTGGVGPVGVLAPRALEGLPDAVVELEPAGDAEEFARCLYGRLRQADRLGLDALVVVPPADEGIGRAVRDRLRRAAAGSATAH